MTAEFGYVELSGSSRELTYPDGTMDRLFRVLARELGVSPAERRAALGATSGAHTVQVAASRDRAAAEALAERLADQGEHGFYEAGGFPALNATAHVVEGVDASGAPVYRVFVGAFLEGADAERVASRLRAAGRRAFVRPLG